MSESLGQAVLELTTDGSKLTRGLKTAEGETKSFSSKAGGALSSFGKTAGVAAGAAGVGALTFALKAGWDEWLQHTKVVAQTESVLKSTGGAAHVTAQHVEELAKQIMGYSGVSEPAVQQAENLLLGFTKIHNELGKGNDIFDRATKVVIDYSARTGKDASSAVQIFGKALNDIGNGAIPKSIRGLGRLSEETQKEIEAHLKAGDAAGAQGVLLAELEKRYQGAAKAAGETLPGQLNILHEKFNAVMGDMVGKGVSFIELHWDSISKTLKDIQDAFQGLMTIVQAVFRVIGPLIESNLKTFADLFRIFADLLHGDFGQAWRDLENLVRDVFTGIYTMVTDFTSKALALLRNAGQYLLDGMWQGIQDGWAPIGTFFTNLETTILGYFSTAGTWLEEKGRLILQGLHDGAIWYFDHTIKLFYVDLPTKVLGYFADAGTWLYNKGKDILGGLHDGAVDGWKEIASWFGGIEGRVSGEVTGALTWLKDKGTDSVVGMKNGAVAGWDSVSGWFGALPGRIGHAVLNGAQDGLELLKQAFGKLFGWLPGWAKDILGIKSPSTVFHEIGVNIVHGLIKGFESMGGKLKDKAQTLIMTPINWVKQELGTVGSYVGDLFTGGATGSTTGFLQLPSSFSATHETMGLPGYPAIDEFGAPGTVVGAPSDGVIERISGRPWSQGWSNGPGSAIGFSYYLRGSKGEYFLTHFDSLYVGQGAHVSRGTPLGTIGNMDAFGRPSHIHEGFHAFAMGGIVTRPTLGLVGEAGPEAIIPLSGARARLGGWPDTIQLVVDGRVLGEISRTEINKTNLVNAYAVPVRT